MNTHADRAQENQSNAGAKSSQKQVGNNGPGLHLENNRPRAAAKTAIQQMADNSARVKQLKAFQEMAYNSPQVRQLRVIQAMADDYTSQTAQRKQINQSIVQRLKWSEVYSGNPIEEIRLSDKQLPEGVQAEDGEGSLVDRNVFAGQVDKGRSGFLWRNEATRQIQYDIKSMMQYKVIDPDTIFYTAVRTSALGPIRKFGIDPNYNNAEKPDGPTQYNVRGFNYFGKDRSIPKVYGENYLAPEPWSILSFKLPLGTLLERDPEIPNGLRTTYHIMPGDIQS